jgi:hypothetical protein
MSIYDVLEGRTAWHVEHGDCRHLTRQLPRGRVVLVADPPYGVGLGNTGDPRGGAHGLTLAGYSTIEDTYEHFVAEVVPRINDALDIAIRAAVFTGPHIHEQRKPDAIGGVYCPAACARNAWGFKSFLPALLYGQAPGLHRGAGIPTVLRSTHTVDRGETCHPVPKPLEWMLWAVSLASEPGDVIFDPFCGSGTTGVAALRLGRRFIGCDLGAEYVAEACERLEAESRMTTIRDVRAGQTALFEPRRMQ